MVRPQYTSFGDAQVETASTTSNNIRFAGQYYDQETGLHYNWHRYYDPKLGRYLRADPIQQKFPEQLGILFQIDSFVYFPTDFHLYVYVQNNPVNSVDPKGLESGEFGGFGGSSGTGTVGNGNFGGKFRDQDDKCNSIASFMNKQYC
jgi:RHS repeat-associated protein